VRDALIHLSVISHRQRSLVSELLADLGRCRTERLTVTVLSNLPEAAPDIPAALAGKVHHLINRRPVGYGANHNFVFRGCRAPFFCVLNPDLRFPEDPFPALMAAFDDPQVGLVAPAATDSRGTLQDNARRLPSIAEVAKKVWRVTPTLDYSEGSGLVPVDWLAGFFMLCRSTVFNDLGGFDERYFLYYEDADLCTRARLAGWKNIWVPGVRVVHDARRRSRRNPKFLLWHLRSIARFFASPAYRAARSARAL
jgi:GT2 family glycosyltransferase